MDFIGGALPNVMFLVGIMAFGIGLGLEFKIIEVKHGLSRNGRIGACGMGVILIAISIALYVRPTLPVNAITAASNTSSAAAAPLEEGAVAPPEETRPALETGPGASPSEVTATPGTPAAPTFTALPATATAEPPSPTSAPATSTPTPLVPTATSIPLVIVPDVRGQEPKQARELLELVGLQLGEKRESCTYLGDVATPEARVRRGRIACQSIQPGASVPAQTVIDYVLVTSQNEDDDDD
jgi:PASTA domain